jgi:hypothetical protein
VEAHVREAERVRARLGRLISGDPSAALQELSE